MRRFFADPASITEGQIRIDSPSERNHIKNVLRMEIGDSALISDGLQYEYESRLVRFSQDEAVFEIIEKRIPQAESRYRITLFQGVSKPGKLETIIQKTTELGVAAVVPVFMTRSIPKTASIDEKKLTRFSKIAAEAAKQCGRAVVPKIFEAKTINEAVEDAASFDLIIMPYEDEEAVSLRQVLTSARQEEGLLPRILPRQRDEQKVSPHHDDVRIAVFIGPEGGFDPSEVRILTNAGAKSCTLGKTILRTETAGPAVLAMLRYELEL